jgi:protein TonB
VYPPAALRRGLQGRVLVRAHVAPDGTPEEVAVARTSGFEQLDRAALEAVRACRRFPRATGAYVAEVPYAFIMTN